MHDARRFAAYYLSPSRYEYAYTIRPITSVAAMVGNLQPALALPLGLARNGAA